MDRPVEFLLKAKVRNQEKIAQAIRAIDQLRRRPPKGWDTVRVLRHLRESR